MDERDRKPRTARTLTTMEAKVKKGSIPGRADALLACSKLVEQEWFRGLVRLADEVDSWNTVNVDCATVSIVIDEQPDDRGDEVTQYRIDAFAVVPCNGSMEVRIEKTRIEDEMI